MAEEKVSAAVVFGCGPLNRINPISRPRVVKAVELYRQGKVQKIVFCGARPSLISIPLGILTEAEGMARLAQQMGVNKKDILKETKSTSTRQNVELVQPVLRKLGCSKVFLVTNPGHIKSAVRLFKRADSQKEFEVASAPTKTSKFVSSIIRPIQLARIKRFRKRRSASK